MTFQVSSPNSTLLSPRAARRKAFTLIEIVLTLFVVGVGIGGSLIALRIGFGMIETARDQTLASQFLQSEIETLRLKNWTQLLELPSEETFVIASDFDDTVTRRFSCTRRIERARPGVDVKEVTVRATWTTSNGIEREISYKTRISRGGLNDYYYRSM